MSKSTQNQLKTLSPAEQVEAQKVLPGLKSVRISHINGFLTVAGTIHGCPVSYTLALGTWAETDSPWIQSVIS